MNNTTEPTGNASVHTAVALRIALWAFSLSAAAFAVGLLVSYVVPGCHCDGGAGCHGCGANGLIEFLLFGGFIGAICSILIGIPVVLAVGVLGVLFGTKRPRDPHV